MSLSAALVGVWAGAYTTLDDSRLAELERAVAAGGAAARDAKLTLAEAVVARYHGGAAAKHEREAFLSVFSDGRAPVDILEVDVAAETVTVLALLELVRPDLSQSARRRLLAQNAVRIDGQSVSDPELTLALRDGTTVRTGRRSWARIRVGRSA